MTHSTQASPSTNSVGLINGQLQLCGNKPNCVSSLNTNRKHKVNPISTGSNSWEKVKLKIENTLKGMQNMKIVTDENNYLRVEFKSKFLGFIDDFEVHFVPDQKILHIRSSSRLGYSDFGVNRKRVQKFTKKFSEA